MGLVDGKRLRKLRWGSDMLETTREEDKEFTELIERWDLTQEIIPLDSIMEWIAERYGPGDVFSIKVLGRWAVTHGYTKYLIFGQRR